MQALGHFKIVLLGFLLMTPASLFEYYVIPVQQVGVRPRLLTGGRTFNNLDLLAALGGSCFNPSKPASKL